MSVPPTNTLVTDDLLYKKYLGVGDAFGPTTGYANEGLGAARPNVLASQVWSINIPTTAPPIPSVDATVWTKDNSWSYAGSERWQYNSLVDSTGSKVLTYYTKVPLAGQNLKPGASYWFTAADATNNPSLNILRNAVPFNYDPAGGYTPKVYVGGSTTNTTSYDTEHPWNFDPDAGFLTFWIPWPAATTATMTFWRYEGPFGVGSGGGGGAGSTGPTGPTGMGAGTFTWAGSDSSVKVLSPSSVSIGNNNTTAYSVEGYSGTVSFTFQSPDTTLQYMAGAASTYINTAPASGFYINSGMYSTRIGGSLAVTGSYTTATVFQVVVNDTTAEYFVDGLLVDTGPGDFSGPLHACIQNVETSARITVVNIHFDLISTGPTGPSKWDTAYLIGAPPALTAGTPTSKSTQIFLPWKNFAQTNVGFMQNYLPATFGLNAYYDTASAMLITKANSTGIFDTTKVTPLISTIVLNKTTVTPGVQNVLFPDSVTRPAYVTYSGSVASGAGANQMHIWFNNYNTGSNTMAITFSGFASAGPPSTPQASGTPISPLGSTTATFRWMPPLYIDGTDNPPGETITNYYIWYSTDGDNTTRYGGKVPQTVGSSGSPLTLGNVLLNAVTGIYPESQYTFSVYAKNSEGVSGTANVYTFAANPSYPTTALSPGNWNGSLTWATGKFITAAVKANNNNASITNLLNTTSGLVTSPFTTTLHNNALRGKNGNGLTITTYITAVTGGPGGEIDSLETSFTSFDTSAPRYSNASDTFFTLAPTVSDFGTGGTAGYFLRDVGDTLTINTGAFGSANGQIVPSPNSYSVTLTQRQFTTGGGAYTTIGPATYTFYYDTLPSANPAFNTGGTTAIALATTTSHYTRVSGIYVVYNVNISVTTWLAAGSLGNYFYVDPMLTYGGGVSTWYPSSETSPSTNTAIQSGYNSGTNSFNGNINFIRTIGTGTITSAYTNVVGVTVTANNTRGSTTNTPASIAAIVDAASVNLIQNVWNTALTSTGSSATQGFRVSSGTVASNNVPAVTTSIVANTAYDNTASIISSQELQVSGGKIVTPGGATNAYLNYSSYFYANGSQNSLNYSTISTTGYRFITFAWRVDKSVARTNGITFTLNNFSPLVITNSSSIYLTTERDLLIYYRVEDTTSPEPTNNAYTSSYWIDGANSTNTGGTNAITGNYFQNISPPVGGLQSVSGGSSPSVSCFCPSILSGVGGDVNIYFRIGLPMSTACSLSGVTAAFN